MSPHRELRLCMVISATAAFVLGGLFLRTALVDSVAPAHTICILLPIAWAGVGVLLGIAYLYALELRELPPLAVRRKVKPKQKTRPVPQKRKRTLV